MANFYFTFGMGHILRNHYVKIEADSYGEAREIMWASFGEKWAMQYTEEDFKGQPEEFGITEIG